MEVSSAFFRVVLLSVASLKHRLMRPFLKQTLQGEIYVYIYLVSVCLCDAVYLRPQATSLESEVKKKLITPRDPGYILRAVQSIDPPLDAKFPMRHICLMSTGNNSNFPIIKHCVLFILAVNRF